MASLDEAGNMKANAAAKISEGLFSLHYVLVTPKPAGNAIGNDLDAASSPSMKRASRVSLPSK